MFITCVLVMDYTEGYVCLQMIATKFSKNFVCEHCKKRYKSFVGLKYHLETQHTDPAVRSYCMFWLLSFLTFVSNVGL